MFECSAGRHWFRSSASIGQGRHLKSTGLGFFATTIRHFCGINELPIINKGGS